MGTTTTKINIKITSNTDTRINEAFKFTQSVKIICS